MSSRKRKIDGNYGTLHRILKILAWRYAKPKDIAEILGISLRSVHYHLSRLRRWGFVINSTEECIMAICLDDEWRECVVILDNNIRHVDCHDVGGGGYYVYASNFYIRKLFSGRPLPSIRRPPTKFINLVEERLRVIKIDNVSLSRYDIVLMAAILQLMAAVLWNPRPLGNNYWARLKHLTTRGIHNKIGDYIVWLAYARAKGELNSMLYNMEQSAPTDLENYVKEVLRSKLYDEEFGRLFIKHYRALMPSLKKIRWILSRMYDYMMVERLGGDHCPYGVWIPHPGLFSPDGSPRTHLPRHIHVNAKHRYKGLGIKQSFIVKQSPDNQPDSQ